MFHRFRLACSCICALLLLGCGEPEDPLDEIRELHRQGRFAQTVDRLRVLLDEDPSQVEANLLLGLALLRTGESGLAVWPLRRAAESPEHAVRAGLLLTQAMLQSRTAPDAIAAIDRVLALEPDNVNALVLRMQAYLATERLEDGLAEIETILALDPDNLAVLVPRVTSLIATGNIDEAEAALETARERIESTEEDVDPELRARLCIAGGMFTYEKGEAEEAEKLYAECLERFPTDPLVVTEAVAFYQRSGQSERSVEILEQGLEKFQTSFFRVALARWMGALGNHEEQERLLREDAETRRSADAWFALADFYVGRDHYDEGIAAFEEALALSRNPSPMLLFAYADTLVQGEYFDKARRAAQGLEQGSLRDLIRGRILLGEGKPEAALAAFDAGIRHWPNNAAGRYLAAQAAERVGRFERAASDYRESIRAAPAQTSAGLELAQLYAARGDHEGALAVIQRYLQAHPGDPEALRVTIRSAHHAGMHGIATQGLERLGRVPDQAGVAAALEAELLASSQGPALAAEAIERSGLDLSAPAHAPALRALLAQLAAQGEHAKALGLVGDALDGQPEAAVFHELRGRALLAAGKSADDSRQAFERALELDAGHAPALAGLAELSAEAGDHDGALAFYDRAAEADPEQSTYPLAAAQLELAAERRDEAARRLEELLERHPREAGAAGDLAEIFAERGELERALVFAQRAAWFRQPEAEARLERIRELREAKSADPAAPASAETNP
jgi:tetratricopeptide (TPR) repeat protein